MSQEDITIAVAAHKRYRMPVDPLYMPLYVGAALHPDVDFGWQRDDEGDNISNRNATYSELTGLWWLWRNCNAPYKGIVHYRRLLGTRDLRRAYARDPYDRLVHADELYRLLASREIVVARRRNYYIETVYSHYAHTFDGAQFDAMRRVLLRACPDYVRAWDVLMHSGGAHIYNMFVMPRALFDDYCSWMFPLVDALVDEFGPLEDPFCARYPGRVSERLLDPWIATRGLTYAELPIVYAEPVDWLAKGAGFLKAKFMGDKYTQSF